MEIERYQQYFSLREKRLLVAAFISLILLLVLFGMRFSGVIDKLPEDEQSGKH